jgi:hypothetical protein
VGEAARVGKLDDYIPKRAETVAIPRRRGNSDARTAPSRGKRNRIRLVFFCFSSLWGFLLGVAVPFSAMKQAGISLNAGLGLYGLLLGAGLVVVVSALLAATLYRNVVKRAWR